MNFTEFPRVRVPVNTRGARQAHRRGKLDATRTEERAFAKASVRTPPWILDEEDGVRFGILNVDGD